MALIEKILTVQTHLIDTSDASAIWNNYDPGHVYVGVSGNSNDKVRYQYYLPADPLDEFDGIDESLITVEILINNNALEYQDQAIQYLRLDAGNAAPDNGFTSSKEAFYGQYSLTYPIIVYHYEIINNPTFSYTLSREDDLYVNYPTALRNWFTNDSWGFVYLKSFAPEGDIFALRIESIQFRLTAEGPDLPTPTPTPTSLKRPVRMYPRKDSRAFQGFR